jgi:bifunctional UDP-N-acetylglucosamine pyrophosphorylase / glucosamine-1-phosphate N-acetyltransferase
MLPMPLNVVILAAGQGKRMYSRRAKVLHPLAGKPLLGHVLAAARELKPQRVCIVYGHGGEAVRELIAAADSSWVRQDEQLGTGHALAQALAHLTRAPLTLVLYGDVPLISVGTLRRLIAEAADGVGVLTMVLDEPSGYGRIVRGPAGAVSHIVEEKDATAEERMLREVNTGLMVLPTARLEGWLARLRNDNAQREYYLTDVVRLALEDAVAVHAVRVAAEWEALGVNSRSDLARLERIYQREYARRLLESGVSLADPSRIDVRGELVCGAEVSIDVNCIFEGRVEIAEGCSVGAHCVLRNVTLGPGTRVEPFTYIDSAVLGANCRIGPYARIRPGTRLDEEVHIGNFVEVKASDIAAGSKANHLAYIGDSTIGRNVNVGAGTITCNYDGAFKHRTVIEDDVFIGSDTQLVAPVTVRRGATIAAGSTITREVAPHSLALSRVKQTAIAPWKRPQKKREA